MFDYKHSSACGARVRGPGRRRVIGLIRRAAQGDQVAFAAFYDATARSVYRMALAVCDENSQAEAMVRGIYVTAWASASSYDASKGDPHQWLAWIATSGPSAAVPGGSGGYGAGGCRPDRPVCRAAARQLR